MKEENKKVIQNAIESMENAIQQIVFLEQIIIQESGFKKTAHETSHGTVFDLNTAIMFLNQIKNEI